ncbi:hypothetical protein [Nocardia sp. NBC_00403]
MIRRVRRHLVDREQHPVQPDSQLGVGYNTDDLAILFGGTQA